MSDVIADLAGIFVYLNENHKGYASDCEKVRTEILRLRAENERLRAALRESDQNFMRVDKERMMLRAALKDAASWLQDAYFDTASEEYKEAELAALAVALKETGDE